MVASSVAAVVVAGRAEQGVASSRVVRMAVRQKRSRVMAKANRQAISLVRRAVRANRLQRSNSLTVWLYKHAIRSTHCVGRIGQSLPRTLRFQHDRAGISSCRVNRNRRLKYFPVPVQITTHNSHRWRIRRYIENLCHLFGHTDSRNSLMHLMAFDAVMRFDQVAD